MTQDIFLHLEDVLNGLREIQHELEMDINDPNLSVQTIDELETSVIEPIINSIESLSDILESVTKMDDADAFYDPYDEGLE
jgi:hypothetical protein